MHVLNAQKIAKANAEDESLRDIFQATSALGSYVWHYPADAESQYIPKSEAHRDLLALLNRLAHSRFLQTGLAESFDDIADWLLYDKDFTANVKYWDKLTKRQRAITCKIFNDVAVQNFRDHLGVSTLPNVETDMNNIPNTIYRGRNPLSRKEDFSVSALSFPTHGINRMTVNANRKSDFADIYGTLKNIGIANIALMMDTIGGMPQSSLPEELRHDAYLWRNLEVNKAYISDEVPDAFRAQFFRRVWDPVTDKMVNDIRNAVAQMDIAPPVRPRTAWQRIMDRIFTFGQ